MKHTGTLSISRPQGGGIPDDTIRMVLCDGSSRARFVEVEIHAKDLLMAITGYAERPMTFDVKSLDLIGMVREVKDELVPYDLYKSSGDSRNAKAIAAALKPYEVDGWIASRDGMTNGHNSVRPAGAPPAQRVSFYRYVKPSTP